MPNLLPRPVFPAGRRAPSTATHSADTGHEIVVSLNDLFGHHLIFVGGKGGVGKTTTAAAIALAAAERGRTCLLVSTDLAHSLGDIFETTIGDVQTPLVNGVIGLEIDPDAEAARHIQTVKDHMKGLVHPRLYDEIDRQLDLASYAPGASEAALLERVAELVGDDGSRFDLVIFDTAPSGHTVRLLSLPEIMGAWTDGLLRHRERSSRLGSALKNLGGGRVKGDDLSMIESAQDHPDDSMGARLNDVLQTRRRKFLVARDKLLDTTTTAFLLVVNPDKLSILESRKIVELLGRFKMDVSAVVVNRVLPDNADISGGFFEARREQEQAYCREIDAAFSEIPRVVVPLLRRDVHGLEPLRELGRRLAQGWIQ